MHLSKESRLKTLSTLVMLCCLVMVMIGASVQAASPLQSYAPLSVIISEIAWGGTAASADEWIELYNPGNQPINLTGWLLAADDNDPKILLMFTIPAGGFYLLERNDDNTIRDITADQVFSTIAGISDSGEVLRLLAPDGTLIDSANLDGGGWPAGSAAPDYFSMERVAPILDADSAWVSNDGINRNGKDANGNPVNGTPKQFYTLWPATPTPTMTFTETSIPADTNTSTNTETATLTATATATLTFTPTPTAPSHLVISEFRSAGPQGQSDEFVELYNPSGGSVNISGWMVKRSSSCGTDISILVTIPVNTSLLPGQHYLVASNSFSGLTGADQTFSLGIADDGGVALTNASGTVIDQVGMCTDTQYREGSVLTPLSGAYDQSYERKPGGATSCYDTNNNAVDFALNPVPNPQNENSPNVMCSGVLTYTPSLTPSRTLTRTPTRTITPMPGVVVINEFLPHPRTDWNDDGTANTGDEFIELINMGTDPVSLKDWKLDDANDGSNPYILPSMSLLPRQIAIFYQIQTGISLSDGGDSVRLFKPNGAMVDSLIYPVVAAADQTWCRLPDGTGTWAFACRPTPGRLNTRIETENEAIDSESNQETEKIFAIKACPSVPVPPSILIAECNSSGGGIWNDIHSEEIWIESRTKWELFLK
jgi:hypothetical protein